MIRNTATRRLRERSDADIAAIVREHAATPAGVSKTVIKDRFWSYADRERAGEMIENMVAAGDLYSARSTGGSGRGKGTTRAFVNRADAVRFASNTEPVRSPKLHDPLDSMGARRGQALTGLRKPGSNARPIQAVALNRPDSVEPRITSDARVTVVESRQDARYTVQQLPPGYRSALDPRECRPWAQAAAQVRVGA